MVQFGINTQEIPQIAKLMGQLGVVSLNIIPLIPLKGTPYELFPRITPSERLGVMRKCESYIPLMKHCRQCRADAAGLLGQDISGNLTIPNEIGTAVAI